MFLEPINFSLIFFAFCGGFVDATVGGGGLIVVPALMYAYPAANLATIFGTNKITALAGATSSALAYIKRVKIPWGLILPTMLSAFLCAYAGALSVALIPKQFMQYCVFFLLIFMAVYTFIKKEMGRTHTQLQTGLKEILKGIILGGLIGFYDGVFGPGSGSFLLFLFIRIFAFDFLHAVASAKLVNMATFTAALLFFIPAGHVLWGTGFYMVLSSIAGAFAGTLFALKFGSGFIRILFLILLIFLIGRMGYTLFF
ncbi:TSUP family transporter [Acinetobacter sp. WZC-1]|uniref:TSUP family transporter n=1 Tax=Acinetobacter sp. WZC-1 TaxID=3459034 RepID=UPI00403DCC21